MMRRIASPVLAGLAALALAGSALGHAGLVSADPPPGGTLTATPHTLSATFDDELTPDGSSIVVEDSAGATVASGTVSAADAHQMTAELPALSAGTYTVRWTAVTADDLAVERGTYVFRVSSPAATASPSPTQPPAGGAGGSSSDLLIAIVLALILVLVVVTFVFARGRR